MHSTNQIYHELMILLLKTPKNIERANWLLWVAHNLERFSDRVTGTSANAPSSSPQANLGEIKSSDDEFWKNQKN